MKKITLSVAALSIAMMSYGQSKDMKDCCKKTAQEVYEYEGLTMSSYSKDSVNVSKYEIWSMIGDLEDILEWQQQDMENGDTNMGSYEEKWGSNYWLTLMLNKLEEIASINAEKWRK